MSGAGTEEQPAIPIYAAGQWATGPFPIPGYDGAHNWGEFMLAGGYYKFAAINDDGDTSLSLCIWHRSDVPAGQPRFLIDICTPFALETVGALGIADVMAVIAAWAPAVQASVLGDLWACAVFKGTDARYNRIAAIGALLAEGAARRTAWSTVAHRRDEEVLERLLTVQHKAE